MLGVSWARSVFVQIPLQQKIRKTMQGVGGG